MNWHRRQLGKKTVNLMRFFTRRPVASLLIALGLLHAFMMALSWRDLVEGAKGEFTSNLRIATGSIEHALSSGAAGKTKIDILDSTGILFLSLYDGDGKLIVEFGNPRASLPQAGEALAKAVKGWDSTFNADGVDYISMDGSLHNADLLVANIPVNNSGQHPFAPSNAKVLSAGYDFSVRMGRVRSDFMAFAFQSGAMLAFIAIALAFLVRQIRITEEKARASAEEAIWVKNQFLSNVSHELRTPLNGIMGMVSLLKETKLDKEQAELANIAGKCADSLLDLVENILLHIKFEVGKTKIVEEEFEIRTVVGLLADTFSTAAEAKGLEFHSTVDPATPEKLVGDSEKVSRILTNLLDNAVKFTREGAVSLSVYFLTRNAERVELELRVSDTGVGIPQHKIGNIFEPFAQGDGSATREFGGLGMGLCLTRELVNALGGRIRAKSREGEGSEFRVILSFGIAFEAKPKAREVPVPPARPPSSGVEVYQLENLISRVGGDRETALKLYRTFSADLAEKPGAILKALDAGGVAAAARLASELKSSAGGMGATALKNAALEVEAAKVTSDAGLMRAKVLALAQVSEETRAKVDAIVASAQAVFGDEQVEGELT